MSNISVSLELVTDHSCSWFQQFVEIRGTSVLAQTLNHLSRKGSSRYGSSYCHYVF